MKKLFLLTVSLSLMCTNLLFAGDLHWSKTTLTTDIDAEIKPAHKIQAQMLKSLLSKGDSLTYPTMIDEIGKEKLLNKYYFAYELIFFVPSSFRRFLPNYLNDANATNETAKMMLALTFDEVSSQEYIKENGLQFMSTNQFTSWATSRQRMLNIFFDKFLKLIYDMDEAKAEVVLKKMKRNLMPRIDNDPTGIWKKQTVKVQLALDSLK